MFQLLFSYFLTAACANLLDDVTCEQVRVNGSCESDYDNAMLNCFKSCSRCEQRGAMTSQT